jgi:hypothetical protein
MDLPCGLINPIILSAFGGADGTRTVRFAATFNASNSDAVKSWV